MNETPYSKYLRKERTSRLLSQESLAKLSGVSLSTIQGLESGRNNPSRDTALKIKRVLESTEKPVPEGVVFSTTEAA